MNRKFVRFYLSIFVIILTLSLLCLGACTSSKSTQSDFYNAGNANLSVTGPNLINTPYSGLTLLPRHIRWHFRVQQTSSQICRPHMSEK